MTAILHDRLEDIAVLREEMVQMCNTGTFFSDDMEDSRHALVKANRRKVEPVFCGCTSCQLVFEQKQSDLLKEKSSAAQKRLTVLREFRLVNDKDTLERTSARYVRAWSIGVTCHV